MANKDKPYITAPSESREIPDEGHRFPWETSAPTPTAPPAQGNWSSLDGKPIWSPPPGPQPDITVPAGLGDRVKAVTDSIPETTMENIRSVREALGGSTQPPKAAATSELPPPTSGHHGAASDSTWTGRYLDYLGLAFILVPPEPVVAALMKGEPIHWEIAVPLLLGAWAVGGLLLYAGLTWPKWKPKNEAVASTMAAATRNIWVWVAVLLSIAFGPTILYSSLSKSAPVKSSPACWDGKAPPCNDESDKPTPGNFGSFASAIPPGPIGPFTPSWEDAIMIEQAFFALPRPCVAKIVANTGEELHARNVLSAILRVNKACDVLDEQPDQVQQRVDIDAPAPQKFSGLIVRWHSGFTEGDKLFALLRGFYNVQEGHVMPDNSPQNLILIRVGSGRWHR